MRNNCKAKCHRFIIGDYILEVTAGGFTYWTINKGKPHRWIIDASTIKDTGIITLNTKQKDLPRFARYRNPFDLSYKIKKENSERIRQKLK